MGKLVISIRKKGGRVNEPITAASLCLVSQEECML